MAAVDASGNPANVAANELVESAWGNAVVARVVRTFANKAAMDAAAAGYNLAITQSDGALWRRLPAGWSRMTATQNEAIGPGGNFPVGTAFLQLDVPIDPGPRLLSMHYQGLAMAQNAGTGVDVALAVNGAQLTAFRLPAVAMTTPVSVSVHAQFIVGSNVAARITVTNLGNTITLYNDPSFNRLMWNAVPV